MSADLASAACAAIMKMSWNNGFEPIVRSAMPLPLNECPAIIWLAGRAFRQHAPLREAVSEFGSHETCVGWALFNPPSLVEWAD
jgi:hypothetical protein